jgi:hypothetical protein
MKFDCSKDNMITDSWKPKLESKTTTKLRVVDLPEILLRHFSEKLKFFFVLKTETGTGIAKD